MATWIVHLRIAEKLIGQVGVFDPVYFSIGNVAPDSGVPDENWEYFDPPVQVTHFKIGEGEGQKLADLNFYRKYLLPWRERREEIKRTSFLWGYFFHLVTDNLWSDRIGRPTMAHFAEDFETDAKFIWQVKRDWYGLDFEYLRGNPASIFWRVFLDAKYDEDFVDFLPQHAIKQQLRYIKDFYQREDEKIEEWYIQRPKKYLSEAEMETFIQNSTQILIDLFRRLWQEGEELQEFEATLELLCEARKHGDAR